MNRIHSAAHVDPAAVLGEGVEVGPGAFIGPNVKIGAGTRVYPNAFIDGWTEIGRDCRIHPGAVVGHEPQDKGFKGGVSYMKLGDRNDVREYATLHRGTEAGSSTTIGDDNLFMAYAHVAHNCKIGNGTIVASCTLLAGFVEIEDNARISGGVVVHQFSRIGRLAMIGGNARVARDVPPFTLLEGNSAVRSLNVVGLRRAGLAPESISALKDVFRVYYRAGHSSAEALKILEAEEASLPAEARHFVRFVRTSQRGVCRFVRYRSASDEE